ncbi:hypothetical protein AVEN_123885-1 [Araneus ventricosus]|uniref:Chitin-binding type-2 domain-containing protein n=1 Tax=Araneus ventricosus TaxID=182803 RepID=A0A4Y2RIJ7_ARAVE|nr:hypothetical protein AVEN_123885-1 [Araneus ventricosus]
MQLLTLILLCCLAAAFSLPSCSATSFPFQTLRPLTVDEKPELLNADGVWISSRVLLNPITCPQTTNAIFIDVDTDCRVYLLCEAGRTPIKKSCTNGQVFDKYSLKCESSALCRHKIVLQSPRYQSPFKSISRLFKQGRP